MFNGLYIGDTKSFYQFIIEEIEVYKKYVHVLDINTPNEDIEKYIIENDIKFLMLPYTWKYLHNPLKVKIPVITNTGDPARRIVGEGKVLREICQKNNIQGIITHSNCTVEPIKDYFEEENKDIFVVNLGICLNIVKDYNLPKEIDVLSTGKFSEYQFRKELHFFLESKSDIKYMRIRNLMEEVDRLNKYIQYSKNMNKSRFCIGHCMQDPKICYYKGKFISDFGPKNLEIMGSNSCLLTTASPDMEYLGVKDGINCVLFSNVREAYRKILYYLDDKELLRKISNNGYELSRKNHNIENTIYNLLNEVNKKYGKN